MSAEAAGEDPGRALSIVAPRKGLAGVRVALVYDCLFPLTVGGAERWYRLLAEALAASGAQVTYLTRRQWDGEMPPIPGVEVVAVSRKEDLYDDVGVRRLGPTLRFGAGCGRYLVTHRDDFDLVQVANFPFWSLLAARGALAGTKVPVVVDWHEVWSLPFWRDYAGTVTGLVGFAVQRVCVAASAHAVVTSARNGQRLKQAGCRAVPMVLAGYLPAESTGRGPDPQPSPARSPPYALFAGRHIFDKGVDLLVDIAAGLAHGNQPIDLVVAGDGPARTALEADVRARGLGGTVRFTGFVSDEELTTLLRGASCVIVPSRREGYGMVLVEATSHGTPAVVADFPENLAIDHVEDGRNGFVASPPTPPAVVQGVRQVILSGEPLRRSTLAWYRDAVATKTMDHSVRLALANYARLVAGP